MTRVYEAALGAVWAMEPTALETLLTIAAREHEISPEALEAYQAKTLAKAEQATVRNGVAVLDINGALIKRATFFSAMSGASSYDILRRDLQAAVDDSKVKAILLNVDSPGGEASGVNELAEAIVAARGSKPVMAYVSGMAASAGYWIASAAGPGNVIIDATAILGSIGVQMAMRAKDDPKGVTTYKFVSSQSPMKNADPGTDEGATHIQSVVDAMATVFVEAVAKYRGVATGTVLSDFGKGGIMVGEQAVKAGLADRLGSFEGVLADLASGRAQQPVKKATTAMTSPKIYSKAEIDAAVAAAMAKPVVPVVRLPTAAELAAQRAEAEALEADAIVARITGTPVAQLTAERHTRQGEAGGDLAACCGTAAQSEAEAIAKRIAAA